MSLADPHRFAELFSGRTDAYGTGQGRWVRQPVTFTEYVLHLEGHGPGLGIAPLRDDGTVSFAAIDLDEPNFEAAEAMATMLPGTSWIERSRSGNAHVLVFFAEPVAGWIPRGILRKATAAIGKPSVEVFPKQDRLLPGMLGNYLNLAYHGEDRPVLLNGEPLPLASFVKLAIGQRNEPKRWEGVARQLGITPPEERPEPMTEFGEQEYLHDCALHIIQNRDTNPIQPGNRSVVYFHLAKQLLNWKHISAEGAWEQVQLVNDASPAPLSERELRRTFDNAAAGRFTSTGCDDPLMSPYVRPDCPILRA